MTGQAPNGREQDPALPGRSLVWSAGRLTPTGGVSTRRRVLSRVGFGLAAAAAVLGLVAGVHAWPVSPPVGTRPSTPLWAAPQVAATSGSTGSRPAAPRPRAQEPAEQRVEPNTTQVPDRVPGAQRGSDRRPSNTPRSRTAQTNVRVSAPPGDEAAKRPSPGEGQSRAEDGNRGRGRGRSGSGSGSASLDRSGSEEDNRGRGRGRSGSTSEDRSGTDDREVSDSGSDAEDQVAVPDHETDRDSSGPGSGRRESDRDRSGRDEGEQRDSESGDSESGKDSSGRGSGDARDDEGEGKDGDTDS